MSTLIEVAAKSKYDTIDVTKNTSGVVTDILFTGLNVTLSDLVNQFPQSGGFSLTVYADTITVDVPEFNALGAILVARQIDISCLNGESWPMPVPTGSNASVLECLLMTSEASGNPIPLSFVTSQNQGTPFFTAPTNNTSISVGQFSINPDGSTNTVQTDCNYVLDMIDRPYALQSLFASFSYAVDLINSGDAASITTAKSALQWICQCISGCGTIPQTHEELYTQASALLFMLDVPANYHYLGVLSADYYNTQIGSLITAIEDYNTNLLQIGNPSSTLTNIFSAVSATAATEAAPTQTELMQVSGAVQSLYADINTLAQNFSIQLQIADTKSDLLTGAIQSAQIAKFVKDSIKTGIDAIGASFSIAKAIAKDGEGAVEAAKAVLETFKQWYETIAGITDTFDQGDLITDAKALMGSTQSMLNAVFASYQLWQLINNPQANTSSINFTPTEITADPNLAWDNFMAEVQAILSNLEGELKASGLGSAQGAANNYLASLQELANYGKAVNTQMIAYSNQMCRAAVLQSKLTTLNNIETIWNKLEAQAASEEEKQAALRSLVNTRIDAAMRSLYVAWENYRSVYLYNNLSEPTQQISMNTDIADAQVAFEGIQSWVAGLPGNGGQGTTFLPNENSQLSLKIPVQVAGTAPADGRPDSEPAGLVAYLAPSDGTNDATISLNIPKITGQFSDQINLDGGNDVAIWITNGKFFLNGIKANQEGYVPLTIATSGRYVNGFGDNLYHFACSAIISSYTYTPGTPATSSNVTVPWSIDPEKYMLPTPFTQWTININQQCDTSTVTELLIELEVNFLLQQS